MFDTTPTLHHVEQGAGEPVVLLHSGGMSSRQWRKLIERLAPSYRVIAPDFLGCGANPPWPAGEPFAFPADVAAVVALLDALPAPAHLVGHSYGGFIAASVARQRPLRSLALYDPVAFGVLYDANDAAGLADLAAAATDPVFTDAEHGGDEAWLEVFVDYWNGHGTWSQLPAPTRAEFVRVGRKVYYEVSSLMSDRTGRAAYAGVSAPALLLSGERSPVAAHRVAALLTAALPSATHAVIAGAGHMGPITHAAEVNERIAAHLASAPR